MMKMLQFYFDPGGIWGCLAEVHSNLAEVHKSIPYIPTKKSAISGALH